MSRLGPVSPGLQPVPDWKALEPRGLYPRVGKRALDALLLLLTGPVAIVLSLPIACINAALYGPHKILFLQERVGLRGRPFVIFKFRTMRDARPAASRPGLDGSLEGPWSQKTQVDDQARVTQFGRFLRSTHFDELPQLGNVLLGDMSVIGPRPEMTQIAAWAACDVAGFESRLAIRPGITGWAQITEGYAPAATSAYARKLARDEEYRRRVSLRFDLRILVLTAIWMLRGRGWSWADTASTGRAAEEPGALPSAEVITSSDKAA